MKGQLGLSMRLSMRNNINCTQRFKIALKGEKWSEW